MCSICGIADFFGEIKDAQKLCTEMGMTLRHRGIDDDGMFSSGAVTLQHNRLSVMDPASGHQPMIAHFAGRRYIIVYNGEIYNTAELRREIESHGVDFATDCDTEVVLWSYIIFGEKCAEHLNGIFAFAVYDEAAGRLYLARDRFGVKPLFYTMKDGALFFASEIKALLAAGAAKPEITHEGLWQLLFMAPARVQGEGIFDGVFELKPGHYAIFDRDGMKTAKYWSLNAKDYSRITFDEAAKYTNRLLCDAIRRQLVSDVPLCTFLSGGLDSSVITAVASDYYNEHGRTLSTYSFEYEGNRENFHSSLFQPREDDEFAKSLAATLGTNHTVLTAPTNDVFGMLTDAVHFRDFPGQADIDSSLLYFCSKVKNNHTVALSGECSDELFGGYPWFYRPEMLYKDFFPWCHDPLARTSLFNDDIVRSKDGYDYVCCIYKSDLDECPILDSDDDESITARRATWLSVKYFMSHLLERKDRMSMASSLEVRVPFADHRLAEFVFNVPWHIKYNGGVEKALLRAAMKDYLPDEILYRKKSPYPKTHSPRYLALCKDELARRMKTDGFLANTLDRAKYSQLLSGGEMTWYGQLMGKAQLIAWLIQLDSFFEQYSVIIK